MPVIRRTPPLLFLIGFVEFFERFGFYTMQGILVLFLMKVKHMSSEDAYHTYGAFSALLFGFVGLGGYCGDKFLGPKNTMFLGLWVMMFGYLGLTFSQKTGFYPSLAAICLGNALFKANPAAIIGHIYQQSQEKLHAAFTIFYMSVNSGALVALVIGPYLSTHYGYEYAFGMSTFGIVIAIFTVFLHQKRLATFQPNHLIRLRFFHYFLGFLILLILWILTVFLLSSYDWVIFGLKILITVVLGLYFIAAFKEQGIVRHKMLAVVVLMLEAVVFFTLYHQMPTSLNMYAIKHVHHYILGHQFDPQSFQALNPFWIITFSPVLAKLYQKNALSHRPWSIFQKFSMGMLCCGISYSILYISHFFADESFHISQFWLVFSYIFQSLAELLVSALGLAMVAELVPNYRMGGVMGMWFLTSAVSGFTGAKVASLTVVPNVAMTSHASLLGFSHVFGEIAVSTLMLSLLMFLTVPFLRKLTK